MKAPGGLGPETAVQPRTGGGGTTHTPPPGALRPVTMGTQTQDMWALPQPCWGHGSQGPSPHRPAPHSGRPQQTCPLPPPAGAQTQAPAGHTRRANLYGGPGAAPEQNRPAAADEHASSGGGRLPDSREGRPGPRAHAAWPLGLQVGATLRPGAGPPAWAPCRPPRPLQTGLCAGCAGRLAPL